MIVGVIGSGGREHAICELLKRSKKVNKIYCFPGNAGTSKIADNVNIDTNNFEIFNFAGASGQPWIFDQRSWIFCQKSWIFVKNHRLFGEETLSKASTGF